MILIKIVLKFDISTIKTIKLVLAKLIFYSVHWAILRSLYQAQNESYFVDSSQLKTPSRYQSEFSVVATISLIALSDSNLANQFGPFVLVGSGVSLPAGSYFVVYLFDADCEMLTKKMLSPEARRCEIISEQSFIRVFIRDRTLLVTRFCWTEIDFVPITVYIVVKWLY